MPASPASSTSSRRRRRLVAPVMLALLLAGGLSAIGLAASASTTLKTTTNTKLGERIVVASSGRTVYTLSGETTHHLLCTSSQCMHFWPPITTSAHGKLKAGNGVSGKLGRISRNGKFQVTLGGHPLYRYSGDSGAGQANGEGIKSFGGTWHVVKASGSSTSAPTMQPTTQSTPSYTPPGY
jgi:predicted lipoprotein with Yx(FWY)xxD motif